MAGRGVLMTLDGDQLHVRAARGEGFKISSTVRDRVLKEKASLLVRDAQLDQALREHMSIVEQKVRSMIAVPLQTNDRVIGLIYVDSPNAIREFTREDLNLLTVMANVAAIRIEHARLNEIEEAERAMAKEMQQAALIQQRLLGSRRPRSKAWTSARKPSPRAPVGGDYYDFIKYPDGRVAMMVGRCGGQRHAGGSADEQPAGPRPRGVRGAGPSGRKNDPAQQEHLRQLSRQPLHHVFHLHRRSQDRPAWFTPMPGTIRRWWCGPKADSKRCEGAGGMILGILPMAQYQEAEHHAGPGRHPGAVQRRRDRSGRSRRSANSAKNAWRTWWPRCAIARPPRSSRRSIARVHAFTQGAPAADDITVVIARRL